MPSAVRLRGRLFGGKSFARKRSPVEGRAARAVVFCRWLRFESGMDRAAAAKIGGMDRQTLRDWVHRFNALGPDGLIDTRTEGPWPRSAGGTVGSVREDRGGWAPDRGERWRRPGGGGSTSSVSSLRGSASNFIRAMSESFLKKLGFSHISARPRHPAQDERIVEAFKGTSRAR